MNKTLSFLSLGILITAQAFAFSRSGFDTPESFVADPESGAYYVSSVNGGALDKDGNGYISKISSNGNIVIQKFIGDKNDSGTMNSPKGLLVLGNELWVADIDAVRIFDKRSAKPIHVIDLSSNGAKSLMDLVADGDGRVYASDLLGDQIFRIDAGGERKATVFYRGSELGNPGAMLYNPRSRGLMAAGFKSGQLFEIDRHGRLHVLKKGFTEPSGIDYDLEGNVYLASRDKGEIYKIPYLGRGTRSVLKSGLTAPADISYSRRHKELLVPSSDANTVTTFYLPGKTGNGGKMNSRSIPLKGNTKGL